MPVTPVQFESSRAKDRARQELREAREEALQKAKSRFEKREAEQERARERGDDKWMLPSLEAQLAEDSGKKSKKHKKDKKHKKKKKKQKSKSSESGSSSNSEDDWVEKGGKQTKESSSSEPSTSQATRDDWMMLPDLIPCITRNEIRQSKKPREEREAEEQKKFMLDQPGQNKRELNPYWKDGGSGLPEQQKDADLKLPSKSVGDQGTGWLRKALQRIYEQAEETGEDPEEIAAERWGSLEKLETMIAEAEGRNRSDVRASFSRNRRNNRPKFAKPSDDFDDAGPSRGSHRGGGGFRKPADDYDDNRVSRRDRRSPDRPRERQSNDRYDRDDRSPERSRNERPRDRRSPDRSRDRRSPDRSRDRRSPNRSRDRRSPERSRQSPSRSRGDDYRRDRSDFSRQRDLKSKFQKPKDSDDEDTPSAPIVRASSSGSRNWRKKTEEPVKQEIKKEASPPKSKSSRRKSSSSSESSDSEPEETVPVVEAPKLLSEKEMNEIGAKIVKAEILGNDTLAQKLKQQLEEARAARSEAKAAGVNLARIEDSTKEEFVVLTKTDSRGFTRPIEEPQYREPTGGRRKKQKVETHNKQGERERYFPDDGKYSLQDIFTREKLNTVEDSNHEFAKLMAKGTKHAGKGEVDLDEVFEEKARMKESDAKKNARERDQAIHEHQRMSNAMDNCQWCVESKKMLKHTLVSLGSKVYLCMPPFQSLTEGHCLLVPTSHATCGTMLDEDVWEEMQTYRKALTKMFASKDEDVIFFESARIIRGFPHMVMECVPVDKDSGALAPIYFKKAIQECEMEWATNVKLVNLAGKGLRRAIPKGLPYFAVNFGEDDGFAHVIEDENAFPPNFAQEIIGGMLDLDHQLWRKRHNENFEAQRRKVVAFAKDWAPFDFTKKRKRESSSSSDSD